jgi:hypothetical protein
VSAQVSIEFDKVSLQRAIDGLEKTKGATGLTVRWLCWDVMRQALNMAIKYTAPRNESGGGGKAIGVGAVTHDLDRAFARDDFDKVKLFESGGRRRGRVKETGVVFEIAPDLWMPNLETHHVSVRNRRGRVPRQPRQAWVKNRDLKKYTASVVSRVGSLKAGWVPALEHFASLTNGAKKIPPWVAKQSVKAGDQSGEIDAEGNGFLKSDNTAHHNAAIRGDMIDFIYRQQNSYISTHLPKRMEAVCDRFNAGQADGKAVTA